MEYPRKTYRPLVIWLVAFLLVLVAIGLLTSHIFHSSVKMVLISIYATTFAGIYSLFVLMDRGNYGYWINGGPTYEQTKAADPLRLKQYLKGHLDIAKSMLISGILYFLISIVLSLPFWVDLLVAPFFILFYAFRSLKIKY